MDNVFIKISDIRNKANKKATLYYQQSNSSKFMKQMIGANPLNREWVDDAASKLKYALQHHGMKRVKAIVQALATLYFCDWVLKQNQYTDNEVQQMLHKAETSYINFCLGYIEQNIHASNKVIDSFTLLFSAIDVISETNPTMAQKYKQMLSRYHSLYSSFQKINDLCNSSYKVFTKSNAQQIGSLLSINESAFKMYPSLKDDIVDIVKTKLDELLHDAQSEIDKMLSESQLSLEKLLLILNNFYDVACPLTNYLGQKRYREMFNKRDEYLKLKNILDIEYKEWFKTFQYYSLPRNRVDENKVLAVINSINKSSDMLDQKFIEIASLSPSPEDIRSFLASLVNQKGKDSIINYYKIENELLNAPESDKKIEEIVRFIKHLNEKVSDRDTNPQLKKELDRMKDDFNTLLDNSIEKKIIEYLSTKPSQNNLIHLFDKMMTYVYDINDLNKISYWQNIKKNVLKAVIEIPNIIENLKKDYHFMQKLPESSAKNTIKEKIKDTIEKLDEMINIMALYQIGEVQSYITLITEIEENLVGKSSFIKSNDRLIILDKFSLKNIVVFNKEILSIGREEEKNDIMLKSDWVSSLHCTINFRDQYLIDSGSTNGTFINEDKEKIKKVELQKINLINIAEAFELYIEKKENFCVMKIVKILDVELLNNEREYIQGLLNTDFVWVKKHGSVAIDTFNGSIKEPASFEGNIGEKRDIIILNDDNFSIIDQENLKPAIAVVENEKIYTDRFSIYLA